VFGLSRDHDWVGELRNRIVNELVAGERTGVLHGLRRAEIPFELREQHSPDDVWTGADQSKVSRKLHPGIVTRGDHAQLELDARRLLALRDHAERPRDLHVAVLCECGKRSCVRNMHERNDRPPDFADRADRDLVRRVFGEHLEARSVRRRDQIVEAKTQLRLFPLQPIGDRPHSEERSHQRRLRKIHVAHRLPGALTIHREFHGVDFHHSGLWNEPVEDAHTVLRQSWRHCNARAVTGSE